ncbi:ABC transporter substrate-binding protein [Dechloromonas sp. ARDL1]|uniref:ABC transporter substrate-binding protein n=1 Tax=Dechloromonas sp. ARDL1 TaxID=3322121 RepID=UPI003DA70093
MTRPADPSRRLFLASAVSLVLARSHSALAAPSTVTVVTSYPDEFVSRIQAAFEKTRPEYRMQVIWRMPNDAYDTLSQPDQGQTDVYWSASPRSFARLAASGAWRRLPIDHHQLPRRIGNTRLGDTEGFYTATEVAGFGFAVAPQALAALGIPMPSDWPDLADPRLSGQIAMPVPSRVGFAPPIVEIVLQTLGWERGWALWSEIAANARFIERGSTFVTDEITSGRCAVGISIDFFVNSAIANRAPIHFVYPKHTGLNPAHIAVTRQAPNPRGAAAFVDFILSPAGQRLLAHPDIRRLAVRPEAYAGAPAGSFDPFIAARLGGLQFDSDAARPRLTTTAAIFQHMLVDAQDELKTLWQRTRQAEAVGKDTRPVRTLLGRPPVDEATANQAEIQQQIGPRLEGSSERPPSSLELTWRDICHDRRAQARRQLDEIGA